MKLAFQLAYKNLMGAGLRTWLNVGILAFTFIVIIFFNAYLEGWNLQAQRDSVKWEYGQGQLRHQAYDPLDPFTLTDAHASYEGPQANYLTPVLIQQASIYPENRMVSIVLKGIEPLQEVSALPTTSLRNEEYALPAIIGQRMAKTNKLAIGDELLLRWRDKNGTFDATTLTIVDIFKTDVGSVDHGQVWIDIAQLWEMTGLAGEATYYIADKNFQASDDESPWTFHNKKMLLKQLTDIIEMKSASSSILYALLLGIALLAIFDTQVLSIFRRQKEIGTYIALGMTRWQVVQLFTIEGSMYSIFASVAGLLIGAPIFYYFASVGIGMPAYATDMDMGISIAQRIYPAFSMQLLLGTIGLVVVAATIVSFIPSRKIAKMDPVSAIKGKIQ
jgi:ABC-type lipoprotein release transport system permease subunit